MHSIKHQARNVAWRYGDDEYVNYNPFAKRSRPYVRRESRNESDDLESGPRRANTADQSPTSSQYFPPHPEALLHGSATQKAPYIPPLHNAASSSNILTDHSDCLSTLVVVDEQEATQTHMEEKKVEHEVVVGDHQKEKALALDVVRTLRRILLGSWVYVLFAFVPAGFAVKYAHANAATIFSINFIAIVPSATLLAFGSDELGLHVGDKVGALLIMTSSNAVQLITSVLLLKTRQIQILRVSLIGIILNNLLLTTGLSFLMGGLKRKEQRFNAAIAQTISMLLLLATISLTIPTTSRLLSSVSEGGIIAQSRGTSVIVLISYALWVIFQPKTHRNAFENEVTTSHPEPGPKEGATPLNLSIMGAGAAAAVGGAVHSSGNLVYTDEPEDEPQISAMAAVATMLISTTLLAFNFLFATDSIQGLLEEAGLTNTFIGIVILPLLGIDPTSILCAVKDKMDLSIALTLERCMQTSLMVVPIIILLAWCMGIDDMTLEFDGFIVAALFASIIIVTYVVQEGRSNWLTGALLIKVFIIISLAAFFIE